jgi:hypothetical protein
MGNTPLRVRITYLGLHGHLVVWFDSDHVGDVGAGTTAEIIQKRSRVKLIYMTAQRLAGGQPLYVWN